MSCSAASSSTARFLASGAPILRGDAILLTSENTVARPTTPPVAGTPQGGRDLDHAPGTVLGKCSTKVKRVPSIAQTLRPPHPDRRVGGYKELAGAFLHPAPRDPARQCHLALASENTVTRP